MKCPECYSEYTRITPLYKPEECLQNHEQYICATCGRVICMDQQTSVIARCFKLFSSFEIAMLYLRAAEILAQGTCAIYPIKSVTSQKVGYKIFPTTTPPPCTERPLFVSARFVPSKEGHIRRLTRVEIARYLKEHQADNAVRLALLIKTTDSAESATNADGSST